jgi:hypothetical protein
MKRLSKIFLATVLLFLFSFAVLAQNKKASVEWDYQWEYWIDVECGEFTDILSGPVTAHVVFHHNKDGDPIKANWHTTGIIFSQETDEVFIVNEVSKDDMQGTSVDLHFNIRGNMGSHYVGSATWDYEPDDTYSGVMTYHKFLCPGGKRNNNK